MMIVDNMSVVCCGSNVSTSSGWSWPTHHEEHQDTQNMLEVDKDGSRRYSHLPPAEVIRHMIYNLNKKNLLISHEIFLGLRSIII